MVFRVTDALFNNRLVDQIASQRQRLAQAQEQVATGRRINRIADDPLGTAAVIEIRASQTELEQLKGNANSADNILTAGDSALDSYQRRLDRLRSLISQGISGFTNDAGRRAIADEIDGLRQMILNQANSRSGNQYIFGGTRQDAPPFDPVTAAPNTGTASPSLIQIEPDAAPIAASVVADTIFSNTGGNIFDTLTAASTAIRGSGDPVADEATLNSALTQLETFAEQAGNARVILAKGLEAVEAAGERIESDTLALETSAQRIESADFVKSSVQMVEAQRALEAILQSGSILKRRSLLDLLG
ncbi:MAG: flagellar hook-associated protein FlgL [Acidobacteriota bacterium]